MHLFWGAWLRTLCHSLKKRKKPRCRVDSNSGPPDYKAIALTTSPPPLPLMEHLTVTETRPTLYFFRIQLKHLACFNILPSVLRLSNNITDWRPSLERTGQPPGFQLSRTTLLGTDRMKKVSASGVKLLWKQSHASVSSWNVFFWLSKKKLNCNQF